MFCLYISNPSIQIISKHVVIVWNRYISLNRINAKAECDKSLIALNKIKCPTFLLLTQLVYTIKPFSYIAYSFLQCSFKTFRSRLHNTSRRYTYVMSRAQLEIFFHVLVYSCQPIVVSVRFKVPQAVVRSQSAVMSKIWTDWFNRANIWIGAIKAMALCSRGFSRGSL